MSHRPPFRRAFVASVLGLALLAAPAQATWSVVAVDRRTGEVCVAIATCIPRSDLSAGVAVIVVGKGGAVSQSLGDTGAAARMVIFDGLQNGDSPAEIRRRLQEEDPMWASKQFGIVDFLNEPEAFGAGGSARKAVSGETGDILYAIQGNVLAGRRVIDECEAAFRSASGDLGQRVMAAMERAREFGGDGRCSCLMGGPDDCGAPPPGFVKSAHSACMLLARIGDIDGVCGQPTGCANGDYTLRLIVRGANQHPDPIITLRSLYDTWRADRAGRPDGILSQVDGVDSLPADGETERTFTIRLVDVEGVPLAHGGAALTVLPEGGSSHANLGPVVDHGDGSYSFALRAGTTSGLDRLVITAADDLVDETLHPVLEVRSDARKPLHVGFDAVSASAGAKVPFVVDVPARAGEKYWLFATVTGSLRGPLVLKPTPEFFPFLPGTSPFYPAPPGRLDARGRADVAFDAPAGLLAPLIGLRVHWTAAVLGQGGLLTTNTMRFDVHP